MAHQHHDHSHDHNHNHDHDHIAAANKEYFDKHASRVPDPRWVELAKRGSTAMREVYHFDEETTTILDFACNTGLTSRELAPYAKLVVGVDISQNAVDVFNEAVSNQGIPADEMRAVCVELKGEEGELDGLKFDVVTCAMSYHHFANIEDITRVLTFFLKPGGVLLVLDIMTPETGAEALFPSEYAHMVPHTEGFTEERLRGVFEGAGLIHDSFKRVTTVTMHEKESAIFIAKATKPSS